MSTFTDTQSCEWEIPVLSVADLSRIKGAGGVDLWAVVRGVGTVDDDIEKLVVTFRWICAAQIKGQGRSTTKGIADFANEWMSDGDNIAAFRHALESEIARFFPSPTRAIWLALVEQRSPKSILSLMSTGSADLPDAIRRGSSATSNSSGDSAGQPNAPASS